MSQADDAFLAGSRSFAMALSGPWTERTGQRPRLAADPDQLVPLCAGSPGLLVVELAPEWVPAIERLRPQAPRLRVVAAVARGQEEIGARLAALGVEVVPWEGQPGPILQAVSRLLADRPQRAAAPTTAPPATQPPALTRSAADPIWPATAPSEEAAESALVLSLRGKLAADAPLAGAAARAAGALSPLERRALIGGPLPFEPAPLYRAAVTRLRTSVALSTVPAPPAQVDQAAVQRLLADLDEVLGQVNQLAARSPEVHQAELEAVRNALVRVAVDFSEAAHRTGPVEALPPPEPAREQGHARLRAETKVLSVHAGSEAEAPGRRRPVGWLVALAVVALATGAFHTWRWSTTPAPQPPATLPGAPANTLTFRNDSGQFLMAFGAAPVDAAELQRFVEQEKQKGRAVREIAPGTWIVEPAKAAKSGSTP